MLWGIDLVILRTLKCGLFTGALAPAGSTLGISGKSSPWMRRNQGIIDRCFYRLKYEIWETLAQIAAVIQIEADLISLTGELLKVVENMLVPERVSLWLKKPRMDRATVGANSGGGPGRSLSRAMGLEWP